MRPCVDPCRVTVSPVWLSSQLFFPTALLFWAEKGLLPLRYRHLKNTQIITTHGLWPLHRDTSFFLFLAVCNVCFCTTVRSAISHIYTYYSSFYIYTYKMRAIWDILERTVCECLCVCVCYLVVGLLFMVGGSWKPDRAT